MTCVWSDLRIRNSLLTHCITLATVILNYLLSIKKDLAIFYTLLNFYKRYRYNILLCGSTIQLPTKSVQIFHADNMDGAVFNLSFSPYLSIYLLLCLFLIQYVTGFCIHYLSYVIYDINIIILLCYHIPVGLCWYILFSLSPSPLLSLYLILPFSFPP